MCVKELTVRSRFDEGMSLWQGNRLRSTRMMEEPERPIPEEPESPVPVPEGDREERDWEERRKVALEAWKMGQKLAEAQSRETAARSRKAATTPRTFRRRMSAR
jgi:hypothetical protein